MVAKTESPQVATRAVSYITAAIVLGLVAAIGGLAVSFSETIARSKPVLAAFPEPAVRTDERAQRLSIEKMQRDRLAGKNGGMPIENAMDMIVGRGSSAYDPITRPSR